MSHSDLDMPVKLEPGLPQGLHCPYRGFFLTLLQPYDLRVIHPAGAIPVEGS